MMKGHDADLDPWNLRPREVVRFEAIREGWGLFRQEAAVWLVTGVVVLAANWAITAAVAALTGHRLPFGGGGFRVALPPAGRLLQFVLASVLNGFLLGGMFRIACRQVRGLPVRVGELFSVTDVLPELVTGTVLYGLAVFAAATCLVLPAFVAAGVLMFTVPLIVDGRMRATDAIALSWNTLKGRWLQATVFHFLLNVLAGLGACACMVGLLFTMPLYTLSVAVLYRDAFLGKADDTPVKPAPPDPDF